MPSRPDGTASYAISVRRARTLLTASFRFRIAPDTLAVRLSVPTTRVRRGLAPPSQRSTTTVDHMALTRPRAMPGAHTKKPLFWKKRGHAGWWRCRDLNPGQHGYEPC